MQTVAVLGLGYVGFPLAELLVKSKKYKVVGLDISPAAVLRARRLLKNKNFTASGDFTALKRADISVVCVPTPTLRNFQPDYGPVKNACLSIVKNLKSGQLVIIESTVNPGTCEEVVMPILERYGAIAGKDFLLAHCPERIDPGNKKWTLVNIPRNVGGLDPESTKRAKEFYRSFLKSEIKVMGSLKGAEATKIIENTFRDINIAYVNELAMSFDAMCIDLLEVIEGAKTKPFAFMPHYPGTGVGGHCISVDPYYLIDRALKSGFEHRFLEMARAVNNGMPAYTVSLLEKELEKLGLKLRHVTMGLLGLAYKPNVADMRESPALKILKILKGKRAKVFTFDPFIPKLSTVKNLGVLLKKCEVIVLATAHREFINLSPQTLKKAGVKLVIDGRNCLPKEKILAAGIAYKGIGH
ncbi:nucleotide sugar dehydrogenase [Candidatus Peregrinibacteria bacterium]|nr:nucleotide sugar dehydrogenase [Candidatus Peregrinibacteria bacterium]